MVWIKADNSNPEIKSTNNVKSMNIKNFLPVIFLLVFSSAAIGQNSENSLNTKKMKILVHVTQGPENPTRAALGFLVARTAIEEGHSVTLFLAGDAVKLLQDSVLNNLTGVGTGKLRDHYDAIIKGSSKFFLSGNSAKARSMTEADIKGKPAEFAMPKILVRLSIDSDKMFIY
jgi:predicted peroxiredoxin